MFTALISWQTYQVSAKTEQSNDRLKSIENELGNTRFSFERMRDIYDRTERYLSSEKQDIPRGRVLVVLISSLPPSETRSELLAIVVEKANLRAIGAAAANAIVAEKLRAAAATPASKLPPTAAPLNSAPPKAPSPGGETSPPSISQKPTSSANGSFIGKLVLRFDQDGYELTLLEPFGFRDSKGVEWMVPVGFKADGTSIPRVAWPIMGAPFEGKLRRPSIILDYYVDARTRSPEDTYRMFYEAMLAEGVTPVQAKTVFAAVSAYGARWSVMPAAN